MANKDHLARLKEGVDGWNAWRKANPDMRPDLSDADLRGATLSRANLRNADLNHARLGDADLREADLRAANLAVAHLSHATLSDANLTGASLRSADLSATDLRAADLTDTRMAFTILTDFDLSQVKGLEKVRHRGPSSIGLDTLIKSQGKIPEAFLRGAGVPDQFIEYMRSLLGKAIEYHSCFISYSSQDDDFARRLYNDLQASNVRCWFAPEDLKIGDKFWECIDASIRVYDKLLVILSAQSVASEWVADEVTRALARERSQPGRLVLFPVRLDDAVLHAPKPWASHLQMNRHIGNFCAWKDHDAYQIAFARRLARPQGPAWLRRRLTRRPPTAILPARIPAPHERTARPMCPTTPPPGFFDLAAPHTPILLWAYGLVSLALVLLAVWSVPRLFRGIPPGHARRSIAWLFGLQAGLVLGGWAIQGLSLLWSDARTHWNASLAGPCISPNQAVANLQSTSALPLPIYMSGVALCFGGLIIGLFVQARIRQTRAELRLPTPAPQS